VGLLDSGFGDAVAGSGRAAGAHDAAWMKRVSRVEAERSRVAARAVRVGSMSRSSCLEARSRRKRLRGASSSSAL
jgi:hypothetical protein